MALNKGNAGIPFPLFRMEKLAVWGDYDGTGGRGRGVVEKQRVLSCLSFGLHLRFSGRVTSLENTVYSVAVLEA